MDMIPVQALWNPVDISRDRFSPGLLSSTNSDTMIGKCRPHVIHSESHDTELIPYHNGLDLN